MNTHTDLAIELKEQFEETDAKRSKHSSGYSFSEDFEENGAIHVSRMEILNRAGEQQFGREKGTYITIEVPKLHQGGAHLLEKVTETIVRQIQSISVWNKKDILLVGIGNREITSDALGPETVASTCVNRHRNIMLEHTGGYNVSALIPGVMSQTGMESLDIIRGVISQIHPKLVIVIDALASRSIHRVNRTIQICDTGIAPGSGLKNYRLVLNEKTLGIPVIAIGVPTVVSTLTIVSEILERVDGGKWKEQILQAMPKTYTEEESDMFVTSKNIDEEIQCLSIIISHAIEACYGLTEKT